MTLRPLRKGDVPRLLSLLDPLGWAYTPSELERLLEWGGGWGWEEGGLSAALTTYSHADVLWIGNVVVDPALRGKGLGTRFLSSVLGEVEARGVRTVGLFSLPSAVPFYERVGFVPRFHVVSERREEGGPLPLPSPSTFKPLGGLLPKVLSFDREESGLDRSDLISRLSSTFPHTSFARIEGGLRGYAIARPSERISEIGPLVAADRKAARDLLLKALQALPKGPVEIVHRKDHPFAETIAREVGFHPQFEAILMLKGEPRTVGGPGSVLFAGMELG